MRKGLALLLISVACLIVCPRIHAGLAPHDVVVVYNSNSRMNGVSKNVADYYCAERSIPLSNQCAIDCPTWPEDESMQPLNSFPDIPDFFSDIQQPIETFLHNRFGSDLVAPGDDPIKAIVLCYGIPSKIWTQGRFSSVDSSLSLLFNRHGPYRRDEGVRRKVSKSIL